MSGPLNLVYPVMALVLLALAVMFWTGRQRLRAIGKRRVRFADIALNREAWPDDVRKVGHNLENQFETPVLFYVLCGVATYVGATGVAMTALAWSYVILRVAHAVIHITVNDVRRAIVFALSLVVLILMWIGVAIRLLGA
jgi:hypothetical protein